MKKSLKTFLSERNGFTIIELLVVIAIIVILVSVVVVSLFGSREKAKIVRFKETVHSLQIKAVEVCPSGSLDFTPNVGSFGVIPSNINVAGITGNQNCGPNGSGIFTFNVSSVDILPECTATIYHTGIKSFDTC